MAMPGGIPGIQQPDEPQAGDDCFRQLVERNVDGALVIDRDGQVRFVNPAAAILFGRLAEEMLGKEFGFPLVAGKTTELSLTASSGTMVVAEMRVSEIEWEGEIGYLASLRDITERRQREEDLRLHAQILETVSKVTGILLRRRSFVEKCTDVLEELRRTVPADQVTFRVLEEEQLRLVAVAAPPTDSAPKRFISLQGLPGEAVQQNDQVVVNDYPSHPRATPSILEKGVKSAAALPVIVEGRTVGVITVLSQEANHFTPDRIRLLKAIGEGLGAQLENARLYEEITAELKQRQRVEDALRASEARFRQLYDEAPVGYQELDVMGRIIRVNRTELEMLGYTPEELLGRPIWDFMVDPENARQTFTSKIDGMISTGGAYERTLLLKDGTTLPALIEDRPIRNASGRIIGLRSTIQDITERKWAEERLMEAARLASIGELAAGVAHEINNPLTVVAGFAEVLMEKHLPPPDGDYVKHIYSESQRVARIVKNLLSFARKHEPQKEYVCITSVLEEALELTAHDLNMNNVRVTRDWSEALPSTMLDVHQLLQVLVNILTNAGHASAWPNGGGEITLRAFDAANKIHISIKDNGPGIDPEHLHKIFDPFFTTKGPGEGTGLGLSICHGIVHQHGGEIWAESQLGAGTTFHIELPILYSPEDTNSGEAQPVDTPGHEQRILVVDDEPAIRDLLGHVLAADGHTVDLPQDGHAALDMIRKHRYDCIIMDLRMPDISGQHLYQMIADTDPGMARRVIFVTGDTVSRETSEFLEATGNPVFSKPINMGDLRQQIQELAETPAGLGKP